MKSVIREILETVVLTILIYLLVRAGVQTFKVEGRSMEPTLQSEQYLLVNKAAYWRFDPQVLERWLPSQLARHDRPFFVFGQPQRGDVVVLRYPQDPTRDFIKRVVALPGETVEIKQGKVFVNDQQLSEGYILDAPVYQLDRRTVPPNNYFVLGDNRNNSLDSHVWGTLPADDLIGKAWVRYWPQDKWGVFSGTSSAAQEAH